ncbi:oxidase [Xylophilus rhododendri]|uniref:Oxidase n=1 Tax=Xylophilus rhododendri TaxID=2697032 RepID=A0A857J0Z5_9BURK|nr:cytochrome C oxidase subunit IV family protein [Xylophilus rhododendri]QHI97376.1 oxidase [Xylophilus rhododendri]
MSRETWASQWRGLVLTWAGLIALMFISLGVAWLPVGAGWKAAAGLLIAGVKAVLVLLVFMQLGRQHVLVRVVVAVALWTLVVMGGLSAVDYLTRVVEPAAVQQPRQLAPAPSRPS